MEEFVVESIEQLTTAVVDTFSATGTRWWFRGQTESAWQLWPSLWRQGYSKQDERYLTNLFYTRARLRHVSCPADRDYGAWLALMQHYGLPTRLLDWTHSPLIAAYFATKYSFDMRRPAGASDAAIWMLEPHRLNESQGYEPVFPPLNARSVRPLVRPAIKRQEESALKVIAVSPLESDLRMLMQQGGFTIHIVSTPLNTFAGCDFWLRKLIVPAQSVGTIARSLDVLGIRLADVFPDLGNLAREITNMHPPPGVSASAI